MGRQTGAEYSAVECKKARVAIRRVVAPAMQPEPASRLMCGVTNWEVHSLLFISFILLKPRHGLKTSKDNKLSQTQIEPNYTPLLRLPQRTIRYRTAAGKQAQVDLVPHAMPTAA